MSKIKVPLENEVIKEGQRILFEHLGPAKVTRFWTAFEIGSGDYLRAKKSMFKGETVDTLYEEILKFKSKQGDSGSNVEI
jgi:hypothetical protein